MIINIAYNNINTGKAVVRFLKYVMGNEKVRLNPFNNPYRKLEALTMAEEGDFLIADAFIHEKPAGFHFAKTMGKKTLLLFCAGEIETEEEGPFWLVLPYGLNRLGEKIHALISQPAPDVEDYEKLEELYPELRERKGHHR